MIEIKGRYNIAKVFVDELDETAKEQIKALCDAEHFKNCIIRIMPDVHAGAGCTIGTTMTIIDRIVPNMVGVDIGCGMETVLLHDREIDFKRLDMVIRERIPHGRDVRAANDCHRYHLEIQLAQLRCKEHVDLERARRSIGTLGGGNHFIEVDRDETNNLYLVVHSGSRHLGTEVAKYYQDQGYLELTGKQTEQPERSEAAVSGISKSMAFVEKKLFDDYLFDMKLVQRFAMLNRRAMVDEIVSGMKLRVKEQFTTIHNYIDTDEMILRKGAVAAHDGQKLLIPFNMRDGSLICVGLGNSDWNYSAPHGAGRLMSRTEAFRKLDLKEYIRQMDKVFSTCVNRDTLDESPMAYKEKERIIAAIEPTAKILHFIKPLYNFKASE